jgi:hypothetical protein
MDILVSNERNELINDDKFSVSLMLKQYVFGFLYFVLIKWVFPIRNKSFRKMKENEINSPIPAVP